MLFAIEHTLIVIEKFTTINERTSTDMTGILLRLSIGRLTLCISEAVLKPLMDIDTTAIHLVDISPQWCPAICILECLQPVTSALVTCVVRIVVVANKHPVTGAQFL